MSDSQIKIIVCCDFNFRIGYKGKLVECSRRNETFKNITTARIIVIMGKSTPMNT